MTKTVAKQTNLAPRAAVRQLEALPQPVVAMAVDYPDGQVIARHVHVRAQLLHASMGAMRVEADRGRWIIPPGFAVWVPAGVAHAVTAVGAISMRTLYVRSDALAALPAALQVVAVSDLLRALILRAVAVPPEALASGEGARLVAVILDELAALKEAPLSLAMPRDPRLLRIAAALDADPADNRPLRDWASMAGIAPRTATRRFAAETGLGFRAWRQRLRLLKALEALAAGRPVAAIGYDLGYDSPSAFTAMFRRATGAPPSRYAAEGSAATPVSR